jgi:hypothetical protein
VFGGTTEAGESIFKLLRLMLQAVH